MANQPVHDPIDFSSVLRLLLTTDPGHADTFNPLFERLINNDAYLINALAGTLPQIMTTQGDIIYQGADGPARLAKGTALQALVMDSLAQKPEWRRIPLISTGYFSRDMSLSDGFQYVTGIGFEPRAIIMFAGESATAHLICISFSGIAGDGAMHSYKVSDLSNSLGGGKYNTGPGFIDIWRDGNNHVIGSLIVAGSDGFTIEWQHTGSPYGYLTCSYMALA